MQPAVQMYFPDHSVFTAHQKSLGEIRRSEILQNEPDFPGQFFENRIQEENTPVRGAAHSGVPSGSQDFHQTKQLRIRGIVRHRAPRSQDESLASGALRGLPLLFQLSLGEAAETRVVQPSHEDS